jgi:hypothetical protein
VTTNVTTTIEITDSEFEPLDLGGEGVPDAICQECAKGARVHTATGTVAVHCEHASIGAWRIHNEWSICMVQPISAEAFDQRTRQMIAMGKAQLMYERSNAPEQ